MSGSRWRGSAWSSTGTSDRPMTEEGFREREVLKARRETLERLRAKGIEPFALNLESALGVPEPDRIDAVREEFGGLEPGEMREAVRTVAGRVVLRRDMGKLKFLVVRDRSGDLQLVASATDTDPASFELLGEVDLGDIVGATGRVGTTRKGELSIFLERIAILTKALRPLPEKWHGLKDPDLQQRYRYLQLATDLESRRIVDARATTLKVMRAYLDERDVAEVETPVLQPVAGGALARPFTTFHQALGIELKLRISLELYLKRLLVGGMDRVYEIGRNFRNEGIGPTYNPEFTMLEAYEAYGDYHSMMRLAEELLVGCARPLRGGGSRSSAACPKRSARTSRWNGRTWPTWPIATASVSIRPGAQGRSCRRCSRSSWRSRCLIRRSSATSPGRSHPSPVPTGRTRR